MRTRVFAGVSCGLVVITQTHAQQVEVPRDIGQRPATFSAPASIQTRTEQTISAKPAKPQVAAGEPVSTKLTVEQMRKAGALAAQQTKKEAPVEQASTARASNPPASKPETVASRSLDRQSHATESIPASPVNMRMETAFTKLANGFDFPVGKPDAQGYYKARGFRSNGHVGEDWDGVGGGDTDLGDPIYCIGDGVVVFARDCHMGWGNVVIVRHAYREGGSVKNIDSLYGHLQKIMVRRGQAIARGQQLGTMGTAHGLYDAHLHLEIRKNLEIGMSRAAFSRDFNNYYDPSQFILSHRHLQTSGNQYRIAMNTFVRDAKINWAAARNYSHSHYRGGSSESAAALKKAVAAQGGQ